MILGGAGAGTGGSSARATRKRIKRTQHTELGVDSEGKCEFGGGHR